MRYLRGRARGDAKLPETHITVIDTDVNWRHWSSMNPPPPILDLTPSAMPCRLHVSHCPPDWHPMNGCVIHHQRSCGRKGKETHRGSLKSRKRRLRDVVERYHLQASCTPCSCDDDDDVHPSVFSTASPRPAVMYQTGWSESCLTMMMGSESFPCGQLFCWIGRWYTMRCSNCDGSLRRLGGVSG
jgi:hypothetical protein